MIPLAPAGIPIGIHPGTDGQLREKNRLKSFFLSSVSFASIAFGYPQRIFGVNPNPPQSKNVAIFSIIAAFHRQAGKLHGILNLQRFSAQHLYN